MGCRMHRGGAGWAAGCMGEGLDVGCRMHGERLDGCSMPWGGAEEQTPPPLHCPE